jgi:hypothetical protein
VGESSGAGEESHWIVRFAGQSTNSRRFVPHIHRVTRRRLFDGIGLNGGPRTPWFEVCVQRRCRDRSRRLARWLCPRTCTELSLRGCFLETSASFEIQRPVLVKIHNLGEEFEAEASVLYVRPSGMGLVFREIKPHIRAVLQKWVLAALDNQPDAPQSPG